MHKVNSICFDYHNWNDYEDMWYDIKEVIKILTKNNYIVVVREEDFQLVYVDFETADTSLGAPYPMWLLPEEAERLEFDDETKEGDNEWSF